MAIPNRNPAQNKYTEQYMGNTSFDEDFGVNATETLGYDGISLQRRVADALASKITVSGNTTYIAIAAPGTSQSTAKWQVKKIVDDGAGTITFTWADGNSNFDNIASDLTSLSYS